MTALDPDPRHVDEDDVRYRAGFAAGHRAAARAGAPPLLTILMVALVAAVVGVVLGISLASATLAASRSAATAIPAATSVPASRPWHAASGNPSLPSEAPLQAPASQPPTVVPIPPSAAKARTGIAAYAARSHGPRYLAIPEGPGVSVTICRGDRCISRTSTDAGPDLAMQRAGRVADLSYVDFRTLCRCRPELVGTMRVRIEYGGPAPTTPATDVKP